MGKLSNESVIIKNDKVYTSYYARACKIVPDRRLVAISIMVPDNFGGQFMRELNPPDYLLCGYKYGSITEDEYIETYNKVVLDKLNPIEIYERLKGKVILCYCGKDKFCHRRLVINWLINNLGQEVFGGEI